MGGIFLRIRTWWETADRTQKVVSIFGSAFLVILLAGTFMFASRPKMALLYGGLTPSELGRVVQEVQRLGIEVDYDLAGNVRVPSDKVAQAQATLAQNGASPTSGHLGAESLDKMGLGISQGVEEARLMAINQGELAKTIEKMSGVAAARVFLSPAKKSSFAVEDEPATASVFVTQKSGGELGPEQAKSIAQMVSRSATGLSMRNITVVNQDGQTLYDGDDEAGKLGGFATKGDAEYAEAKRVKRELQGALDRAFGAGNTLVTCRIEMDMDVTSIKKDTPIASESPVTTASTKETMAPDKASGSATSSTVGKDVGYSGEIKHEDYGQGTIHEERTPAKGKVLSMALSAFVNSESKSVKAGDVQKFLDAYIAPMKAGATADKFTSSVISTAFDKKAAEDLKKAGDAAATSDRMQQIFSLLPIVALVAVAFLVLKALGKAAKSSTNVVVQALPGGRVAGGQLALAAGTSGAAPTGGGTAAGNEVLARIQEAQLQDEVEVGSIVDRLNVPLEQIKKMSHEKPTVVAMLLKSWLLEDGR